MSFMLRQGSSGTVYVQTKSDGNPNERANKTSAAFQNERREVAIGVRVDVDHFGNGLRGEVIATRKYGDGVTLVKVKCDCGRVVEVSAGRVKETKKK